MKFWSLFFALAAGALALPQAANAQAFVEFGNDSSTWSNDGECDDPRFEGSGMATTLLDSDILADASDCRALVEQGAIRLRASSVNFGDNSSRWANDDECDDPRFVGTGMATTLLDEDAYSDANDCRSLYVARQIDLRYGVPANNAAAVSPNSLQFGDDSSQWANDGECDDPRFADAVPDGGMASVLLDEDLGRDASDCRALFNSGRIRLK